MQSLTLNQVTVKPEVLTTKAFDNLLTGEWSLEVVFSGGAKVVIPATEIEVKTIERDLTEAGWRVSPSLFHNGFNARRLGA